MSARTRTVMQVSSITFLFVRSRISVLRLKSTQELRSSARIP